MTTSSLRAVLELLLGVLILGGIVAIGSIVHYFHLGDLVIGALLGGIVLWMAYLIGHSLIGEPDDEDSHGV